MDIDLNVSNYSIDDLKRFFNVNPAVKVDEVLLNQKMMELQDRIIISENVTNEFKRNFNHFLNDATNILLKSLHAEDATQERKLDNLEINQTQIPIKTPNPNPDTNVGTILNPLSNHQPLETTYISNSKPLQYTHFNSNYILNTRYRDDFFNTTPNNCTFTLPVTIKNVISITLSAMQYPNVMWSFSSVTHTNQIYIREDTTNNEGIVVLPEGNYTFITMPDALTKAINEQIIGLSGPNRFTVTIDLASRRTTISNSTYTFIMKIITPYPNKLGVNCLLDNYNYTFKKGGDDPKTKIRPSDVYGSLGFLLGYRELVYTNQQSYTSESIFEQDRFHYVYFALNDYVGNSNKTNIGILPYSVLNQNILALIPITSPDYTTTFADGSTYIFRTRNYNGPVNINKLSIKLINPTGELADIHRCEFTFCLQVKSIANMTVPYSYTD